MTVLEQLRARLAGHTCYAGCGDLLCLAAREIEALSEGERLIRDARGELLSAGELCLFDPPSVAMGDWLDAREKAAKP